MSLPEPESVDAVDVPALHAWLAGHRDTLLTDLLSYAERESPSNHKLLLDSTLEYLTGWLDHRLDPGDAGTRHAGGAYGDMVVLDLPGVGPHRLTCLCHYDTVWEAGTLADWLVTVDGDRATGPGVFDMKAGLVQLVWALRALRTLRLPTPPVRLVLNGDEEIGNPFSRPLLERCSADAAAVLVFEPSAAGAVKTARKGVGLFDLTVDGVEAHAGLDPEKGASAIAEMARVVQALHAASDQKAGTSLNVGVLRGGTRANVVAGSAHAALDVRVGTVAEQDRVDALLAGLHPHDPRAHLSVSGEWNRPVMARTPAIEGMYALAARAARQLGVTLEQAAVGGASDGNFAAALGVPVLDGLGAVGDGAHARHEHVSVAGMLERSAVAAAVISAFAG